MNCPHCGIKIERARKTTTTTTAPVDTSDLSLKDLYQHYKRTAPYEDLKFFLAHARISDALRADAIALFARVAPDGKLAGLTRSEFYRQYFNLSDRSRVESIARDGQNVPAILAA